MFDDFIIKRSGLTYVHNFLEGKGVNRLFKQVENNLMNR